MTSGYYDKMLDDLLIRLITEIWSQTRGPREGPMRPANIRKNEDFSLI